MAVDKHDILFRARRSIRYHDHRRAYFDTLHQITSVLTILLSSSIILQVAGSDYELKNWFLIVSIPAALFAAIDVVIGYAKMANLHRDLKRRFGLLEIKIESTTRKSELVECNVELLNIELDEPAVYRALDVMSHNELLIATGWNPNDIEDQKDFRDISWFQRKTAHFIKWPNIGHDSMKGSRKMNVKSIVGAMAVICLLVFGFNQYSGYQAYQTAQAAQDAAQKEPVFNKAADGSVSQVEQWFAANLENPASLKIHEWSPVVKTEQGNYVVRCKYSVKNKKGEIEENNKAFILGSTGIVLAVSDYES